MYHYRRYTVWSFILLLIIVFQVNQSNNNKTKTTKATTNKHHGPYWYEWNFKKTVDTRYTDFFFCWFKIDISNKVAKTQAVTVSAAILCPVVCIRDIRMWQIIKYVTSQFCLLLNGREQTNMVKNEELTFEAKCTALVWVLAEQQNEACIWTFSVCSGQLASWFLHFTAPSSINLN